MKKNHKLLHKLNLEEKYISESANRPINKEELKSILGDNTHFKEAIEQHGSLFAEYIITHISPRGIQVPGTGHAFLGHLGRTDIDFCKDLEICQQNLNKIWHTQNYLRLFHKNYIIPDEAYKAYMDNVQALDQPKLTFLYSSSETSQPKKFDNASPMEPEFFDLGMATDLFYELPFNLCGLVLVFLAIIKLYRNRLLVRPAYLIDKQTCAILGFCKISSQLNQK